MQLYFIRHAQSQNNLLWDMTGSNRGRSDDPELSEIGCEQARLLAQFLNRQDPAFVPRRRDYNDRAGFGLTHLYTSLMLRAVQTASLVADALDMPLLALEDLCETGGIYLEDQESGKRVGRPGKARAFFERSYPRLVLPEGCSDNGWWNRPFEEFDQVMPRARRFWHDLLQRHGQTSDHVALFSHGDFYNCLLRVIFQLERSNMWLDLNNAAITRIDLLEDNVHLVYANRVDFLPNELIT